MTIERLCMGGAIAAFSTCILDALEPMTLPEGELCSEKKLLVLGQYALIGSTVVGTISALFLYTIASTAAFIFAVWQVPISLLGAYAIKQFALQGSLEEDTEALKRVKDEYALQVQKMTAAVSLMTLKVESLEKINKEKEGYALERDKALSEITQKLGEAKIEVESLEKKITSFEKIPEVLAERVQQLANKISQFTTARKELNLALAVANQNEKALLDESISNLKNQHLSLEKQVNTLASMIDVLDHLVDSIITFYKGIEQSQERLKQELKSWQIGKATEQLGVQSSQIHKDSSLIVASTHSAVNTIQNAKDTQAQLEALLGGKK